MTTLYNRLVANGFTLEDDLPKRHRIREALMLAEGRCFDANDAAGSLQNLQMISMDELPGFSPPGQIFFAEFQLAEKMAVGALFVVRDVSKMTENMRRRYTERVGDPNKNPGGYMLTSALFVEEAENLPIKLIARPQFALNKEGRIVGPMQLKETNPELQIKILYPCLLALSSTSP